MVQASKQSFWGGLCSERNAFLRAAGTRRARSRIWTLDGHQTDTVFRWTLDGHCVGVGVCFWLCGGAGVFWLCGGAGVFLAVWVCGCVLSVRECGCVFGCVGVWGCFDCVECACVFGCVGVWVWFVLGWVVYAVSFASLMSVLGLSVLSPSFRSFGYVRTYGRTDVHEKKKQR